MYLRKIAAVGLLALAFTGVGVGTAGAESAVIKGAYGYYDPNKHMFGIGDTEPDGKYVYLEWSIDGYRKTPFYNYNGNGTWRDVTLSSSLWGHQMQWRICRDGGPCSYWYWERV
ncbi:hypothetical protein [Kitasatospora sp. NPDC091207]|uniref:hypothetical protein n=1 Tax=Kitasatospora sp. NPDC091207 TaxID=3364083 RepID=UPI003805C13A